MNMQPINHFHVTTSSVQLASLYEPTGVPNPILAFVQVGLNTLPLPTLIFSLDTFIHLFNQTSC